MAISQITPPRAAVAKRTGEHPTRAVVANTLQVDGKPEEIQADTLIAEDQMPSLKETLVSADQWHSAGASAPSLRSQRAKTDQRVTVVGYASVNAPREEGSNDDLQRQVDEIVCECGRRGLALLEVVREGVRKRQRPLERPGLGYALGRIAAGEAEGLVVAELAGVCRAVPDLGSVLIWLTRREARLVVAVPRIDTGEQTGRLVVRTIIEVSSWERKRLGERTRDGMRAAGRKGPASVADSPDLRARIAAMRSTGMTLQAIADQLNAEGVPTVRGGAKWRPSSVQAAVGYQRPPTSHTPDLRLARTDHKHAEAYEA
jgi:DNA invertase Pin-like site-specific DNA recombinase